MLATELALRETRSFGRACPALTRETITGDEAGALGDRPRRFYQRPCSALSGHPIVRGGKFHLGPIGFVWRKVALQIDPDATRL